VQWMARLERYVFPTLGATPVGGIDRAAVRRTFSPQWTKEGPIHALSRTLGYVANVLDFATQRGWRDGPNPAQWDGNLEHALARPAKLRPVRPMKAIGYQDLPAFYATLNRSEAVTSRAIEFTILTAARSGEAIGARWEEIDPDARVWKLPAGRMKGRREHVVPLTQAACEILKALPREKGNPYCFVGAREGGPLNDTAMISALHRLKTGFTIHGFRSAFRTWAGEQTAFSPDIIEMSLAHAVGSGVERAYDRSTLLE
jgi:integrase